MKEKRQNLHAGIVTKKSNMNIVLVGIWSSRNWAEDLAVISVLKPGLRSLEIFVAVYI